MIGLEFFQKIYTPESKLTIVDAGAHCGDSVQEFIELFPMSRVFAFEPDRKNFARLSERFAGNPSVQLINAAVGQRDGHVLLHKNNYDATHSLLPFNSQEINRWADANDFFESGTEEVDQVSLDGFCNSNGIRNIDILKLDIQGGEMMAFQGAEGKLAEQEIGSIFCEVEFRQLYENQPLFWDISSYLMSRKYHFMNIVSPKLSEMGVISWADAIYVNEKIWQDVAARHSAGRIVNS
jgi:FkbM family methyltransferase